VTCQQLGIEAGLGGTGLDDPGDGAGIDRHRADAGQGRVAAVPAASCQDRKARIGQSSVVP
jgi:hypothetical protein